MGLGNGMVGWLDGIQVLVYMILEEKAGFT
jgi:hypothetical protein